MAIQQPNGSSGYLAQLTILHAALVMGVALMGVVMYFVATPNAGSTDADSSALFNWLAPVIAIGGLLGSSVVFRMQVQKAQALQGLADKLSAYRAASITRYALIEGPAILSFVAYFLEGKFHYLALGGLLLIVLFLYRPTKDRIVNDLNLNTREQAELGGM